MAYRYGRLGIQIWETWHTDMGDLKNKELQACHRVWKHRV
jgi:hypothetical protein